MYIFSRTGKNIRVEQPNNVGKPNFYLWTLLSIMLRIIW